MNSQKWNKDELYPEDFTDDEKLEFDILLQQSKQLFPKLSKDEWLIKQAVLAFMRKKKLGIDTPATQEEIAEIRNQYTKDTIFYTPPKEEEERIELKEEVEVSA